MKENSKQIPFTTIHLLLLLASITAVHCSLKPPPITFTQSPTAAERQMIGNDKDLEKDGWIISSIRTSASGSDVWEKEILEKEIPDADLDETTYIALRRLAYLSGDVREFKKKDFIGEALDGELKINPLWKESRFQKDFNSAKPKLDELLKQVNESRKIIYDKRVSLLERETLKETELMKRKNNYLLTYYGMVEEGEYFEAKKGKWAKKD